jgi:hypothetical protein
VLRPDGRFVLSDNYAPDDAALDRWINELETVRDPSHVREHTIAGWRELLAGAELRVTDEARSVTPLETEPWLARSRTPEREGERVRQMLRHATPAAREVFAVRDGTFQLLKVVLRAVR